MHVFFSLFLQPEPWCFESHIHWISHLQLPILYHYTSHKGFLISIPRNSQLSNPPILKQHSKQIGLGSHQKYLNKPYFLEKVWCSNAQRLFLIWIERPNLRFNLFCGDIGLSTTGVRKEKST